MNDKAVTLERMEAALDYRACGDDRYAELKASVLRCEIRCKRVRARVFIATEGKNIEERKARVEDHPDVVAADEDYVAVTLEYERERSVRATGDILIDVYRTLEASRRKG